MSGLSSVLPEHGGRVVLRRQSVGETTAQYAVQILTPAGQIEGLAMIGISEGSIELRQLEDVPEWLTTLARTLLRGAWRARNKSPWPRRLTRWREAPQT